MMELLAFGDTGWGDELLISAVMTILVSTSSLFLGLIIGTIFASFKLSSSYILKFIAETYTTVIRGVPELLVIYLLFFGGSSALMYVASIFGHNGYLELSPFTIGTIAVGAISGAYSTEVIRGAILAVPKGQFEAANTLGMSKYSMFFKIIFPQVARIALPGIGNVWQVTLKDTALISVTGLVEIMRQSRVAAGSTHEPFIFYAVAIVLYLIITSFSSKLFNRAESRFSKGFVREDI
jgi:octopine/nopaline transport system permease protein|tara:strand:- start:75 stop:785 length:711 start_codon:yes stop_codon:yes gene_type:complete